MIEEETLTFVGVFCFYWSGKGSKGGATERRAEATDRRSKATDENQSDEKKSRNDG